MPQPEGRLPQVVKKKEGHMPELRKRRSHLALLGVFAMVASVLAVGASPAAAQDGRPEAAASYSACVGPATADAGFTDVATGSTFDAAINCIAYYGITRGTTATTFAPNQTISRWQLAVMLQRAAGPAGVDLPADQAMGFTDISGLPSSWQTAINQMARLGVMAGTTATTFDPDGIVSRAVIVEALAGFLTNARVGPGGRAISRDVDGRITVKEDAASNAATITVDETFRDIGGVTYAANYSIRALAEMGVVSGRGDNTFGPAASVTRAQAAAFITRALAHTNARPAGLTMQTTKSAYASTADFDLSISVRGNDFAPVESASIDVIRYLARDAQSAFKTDGTCNIGATGVSGSTDPCEITISDEVTEPDGNLLATPPGANSGRVNQDTVFVAWTGDTGDKLDWDDASLSRDNSVSSSAATLAVGTVTVPSEAKVTTSVSTDAEGGNTVRYGTTVTVTIQLVDSKGANIGVAGKAYSWYATGVHNPVSSILAGTGTRTVVTDSNGTATFTLTQSDPDTNKDQDLPGQDDGANDQTTWTYYITAVGSMENPAVNPVANSMTGFTASGTSGSGTVVFDDDDSSANKVSIELQRAWTPQSTSGGAASVGVTGKVTDQYGNTLRGHPIFFDVDGDGTFGDGSNTILADGTMAMTTRRVTRSSGANTISASVTGNVNGDASMPTYSVAANLNAGDGGDTDVGDPNEIATATHYWTQPPAGLNAVTGVAQATSWAPILYADLARNTLIQRSIWPSDPGHVIPRAYTYTDTTLFRWWVNGAPNNVRWLSMEDFEARMGKLIGPDPSMPMGGGTLSIVQFNTKTGFSVLDIRLNTGTDIGDPAG